MADIKTRDDAKGTIKTLDKAAVASERMKSVLTKTKDTAKQNDPDEHAATEYAADTISDTAVRMTGKGIRELNKQGRKSVTDTRETVDKVKTKLSNFKAKRMVDSAANQMAGPGSSAPPFNYRTTNRSFVPAPQSAALGNTLPQASVRSAKTIKQFTHGTGKTVRTTAKGTVKAASKGVKTAQSTSRAAVKTTHQAAKTAQAATRVSAKTAQKAAQTVRTMAKATAYAVKATVRASVSAVKAIIAGTKALITVITAGGWIAVVIILIVVLFGSVISLFGNGSGTSSYTPVSAQVEAYMPFIQKYARQYGIPEYAELIKAVMMQESGGRGNDPMQAAECSYNTRYPHAPNGITDPEYSINVGVQNLAACLKTTGVDGPIDISNISLALQGYNYGNGYVAWAKAKYGGYTSTNAAEFSNLQAARLGWSHYGDSQYVPHVLRYYPFGRMSPGVGSNAMVKVAASQIGNIGGQPYWSWYGFNGHVEWCACFVSWCADQSGYIKAGIIPKFSLCSAGASWFLKNGQWKDRNYTPTTGDIIFFDWNSDGSIEHVGIVEKVENGTVCTIEGNSSDSCRRRSYAIGDSDIYGYGTPAY